MIAKITSPIPGPSSLHRPRRKSLRVVACGVVFIQRIKCVSLLIPSYNLPDRGWKGAQARVGAPNVRRNLPSEQRTLRFRFVLACSMRAAQLATLRGISTDTFAQLCDALARALPSARRAALEHVRLHLHTAHEEDAALRGLHTLPLPMANVRIALGELLSPGSNDANAASAAAGIAGAGEGEGGRQFPNRSITPPHARGVLSMVTVSPPTALLRSPAMTGLTKMYAANNFREHLLLSCVHVE
jgi:hypothetical protein